LWAGLYISFIGIRTLFDQITRGYGDHSPGRVYIGRVLFGNRVVDDFDSPLVC